ncbi:hypothetical protein BOX15_Mlig013494g1, partial [Macrostomum lignano]
NCHSKVNSLFFREKMLTIKDYQILQYLGSGTFGTCSKVCLKADPKKIFAWKETDYNQFSESQLQMLCQEVNLLRSLQHQNIVRFYGRIVDKSTGRLYVVMEYCSNGDLSSLIAYFSGVNRLLPNCLVPESFVRRLCAQLLSALDYCHSRNILHRDLKPANVLLDSDWNAKLADFGLSRVLSSMQSLATTFVGTPMYMSPELLGDSEAEGFSTPKSDIWALGCVLHELMALKPPFSAQSKPELRHRIRSGCHADLPVMFSPSLRHLATEMVVLDHSKRPSAGELLGRAEVRLWSVSKTKDFGCTVYTRGRAELQLMQADLSDKEAKLAERERLLAEAEEKVNQRQTELVELDKALKEKQQLIAKATGSVTRPRRHTETGVQAMKPKQQQQKCQLQQPASRHRIALQSIDCSPIAAVSNSPQQQQQLLERGTTVVRDARKVTLAKGKYVSPVATPPEGCEQRRAPQPGRYEPVLDMTLRRRQKQLLQKCSPDPGACV